MAKKVFILILFVIISAVFFYPFFLKGLLPIPADTIVSMYHPFIDSSHQGSYKNSLITDPVRQQYPWRELAMSLQTQNILPIWNPYTFSGSPLLANFQTAAFYPFNLFFFLFPYGIAWSVLIYLQPLLAGLFLYVYLRHLKLSFYACVLGGITFAFSGFMTAWLEWGTLGHTALWLPLLLLSIDKLLIGALTTRKKVILWSSLFVFSLAASLFAGHVQTFFYGLLVALGYFIIRWIRFGRSRKHMFLFAGLFSIAAVVTCIQWLPTFNFILLSARSVDLVDNWTQAGWFIPWQHLVQFIAPDFFGNPSTLNYWGEWNYGEFVGYVGIVPFIMALYALFFRKDKKTLFFGIFFVSSMLFALPTIVAQIPYMLQIPFLSTMQPTRLLFIADFCLAVLAALGLDRYTSSKDKKKMLYCLSFIAFILGLLWVFAIKGEAIAQISQEHVNTAKRNLVVPSILFLCSSVLICALFFVKRIKNKYFIPVILTCLLLITLIDLFRFSQKFNTFSDPKFLFPETKIMNYLQEQSGQFRIMSTSSELLPPNFSVVYRLQTIEGYDPLYLLRYGEFMSALRQNRPDISTPFKFNRIVLSHNIESRLVDLVGVKYILSMSERKDHSLEKKLTEGKTILYENKDAFPRTFFVQDIVASETKEESIKTLYDKRINLRQTAVVEGWDKTTQNFGKGSAEIVKYEENQISINTSSDKEGYLVLMDAYYPTWHAQICSSSGDECNDTKIYLTNYAFRGIIVPEGKHIIKFVVTLF